MTFVDTNIWLYALTKSDEGDKKAPSLALVNSTDVILSSQVVNEILKNYRKLSPASEQELREIARDLYKSYEIVDITEKVILLASELREEYMFSYWDSLIVATALDAGATMILTQDMQNGLVVRNRLTIRNPYK